MQEWLQNAAKKLRFCLINSRKRGSWLQMKIYKAESLSLEIENYQRATGLFESGYPLGKIVSWFKLQAIIWVMLIWKVWKFSKFAFYKLQRGLRNQIFQQTNPIEEYATIVTMRNKLSQKGCFQLAIQLLDEYYGEFILLGKIISWMRKFTSDFGQYQWLPGAIWAHWIKISTNHRESDLLPASRI